MVHSMHYDVLKLVTPRKAQFYNIYIYIYSLYIIYYTLLYIIILTKIYVIGVTTNICLL